jgi:gliding-associated putative ABC transporter substrate-binding component GldG
VSGRMVADMECSKIPLQVGQMGNSPQFDLFPWFFHPIVSPKNNHPIVKGLDRVNLFFPTTIDTSVVVKTDMKKTVLLSSSKNSKEYPNLTRLSFEMMRIDPTKIETFTKSDLPVAVLYEGVFPSAYENRVSKTMLESLKQLDVTYKPISEPTKMIVISDGDIVKNQVKYETGEYMPTGFNKYENYTFANKDFLINCIEYLLDDNGVIEARGKEVKLRLLDAVRAKKEQTKWQMINIVLPLVFLAIFGFIFFTIRKRRYAR